MDASDMDSTSESTSSSSLFFPVGGDEDSSGSAGLSPPSTPPAVQNYEGQEAVDKGAGPPRIPSDRGRSVSLSPSIAFRRDSSKSWEGKRYQTSESLRSSWSTPRGQSTEIEAANQVPRRHVARVPQARHCRGSIDEYGVQANVEREAGESQNRKYKQNAPGLGVRKIGARHRVSDMGITLQHHAESYRRQRPLSAPAEAYTLRHEPGLSGAEIEGTPDVEIGVRSPDYTARTPRGHGEDDGRQVIASSNGQTDDVDHGATWLGFNDAPQEELSLLSATAGASARGTAERSAAEMRSWMLGGLMVERRVSSTSGGKEEKQEMPLSPHDFGLRRWKEYAVLRHGNNKRFVNSLHGREILLETASALRAEEVEDLKRELNEMRELAEELHVALRTQQAEKAKLQSRIALLERDVEGMDYARRRRLRDDASSRGRGSNLERRLAGNMGTLRTFLFGADAKMVSTTTPTASPKAASARAASVTRGSSSPRAARGTQNTSMMGSAVPNSSCLGAGDDNDGDVLESEQEISLLRRMRETAELEKSELRRRHDVEMASKSSRIGKMRLDIKKLEAERDGLKNAAETQAGLYAGGYAELRACLVEMRAYRKEPSLDVAVELKETASTNADHAVAGAGESGLVVEDAQSFGIVPATQEGLNSQVQTLQALLLEAVSAAPPTAVMPPKATATGEPIQGSAYGGGPSFPRVPPSPLLPVGHQSRLARVAGVASAEKCRATPAVGHENIQNTEFSSSNESHGTRGGLGKDHDEAGPFYSQITEETGSQTAMRFRPQTHENFGRRARDPVETSEKPRQDDKNTVVEDDTVSREMASGLGEGLAESHERGGSKGQYVAAERRAREKFRAMWSRKGEQGIDGNASNAGSDGSGFSFPRVLPMDDDSGEDERDSFTLPFEEDAPSMEARGLRTSDDAFRKGSATLRT